MRAWLIVAALLFVSPAWAEGRSATVYKSPTCGCCTGWAQHLSESGYEVQVRDLDNLSMVKDYLKVPPAFSSCHTAVVEGYVVEGHVPAEAIDKLLAERPDIRGIALPGMPVGTPGMPGPKEEIWTVYTIEDQPRVFWQK